MGNRGHTAFFSSEQSKVFNTIQGGLAVTNDDRLAERLREYYDKAPQPEENRIDRQLHMVILNYYRFKHPQRWWRGDLALLRNAKEPLVSTTREEERGIRPDDYGRKMAPPVAALGINQLEKIDRYNNRRRETAHKWDRWCKSNHYKSPWVVPGSSPVYLRYPLLVEPGKKSDLSWAIKETGVLPGVWFVGNLHPSPKKISGCPNADKAVRQCINFPTLLD